MAKLVQKLAEMITLLKESLWKQFGASIDMLHDAIAMWPEENWETKKKFFYIAYHTLIFLEYYLSYPVPKNFNAELPFTEDNDRVEDGVDDILPHRFYSKDELLRYLRSCREKCYQVITNLTEENIHDRWIDPSGHKNYSIVELLLYNMRHVQHHAAQLNMILRKEMDQAPKWIGRARGER